jgi:choline dehydrogenase-like flavoprotein
MSIDSDVIVVGSGAGGGTLAAACARLGRRVILVERGQRQSSSGSPADERQFMAKTAFDDRTVRWNGQSQRPFVSGQLGGGTSLYGAALIRPSRGDFSPGRYYGHRLPRELWEWPVSYDDLAPYYQEAEQLYGVSSRSTDCFAPLEPPAVATDNRLPPFHAINHRIVNANRNHGLHPFHLPLGIDFSRCWQCATCPGYQCPTGARRSARDLIDMVRSEGCPIDVLTNTEVESLHRDPAGKVVGIQVMDRQTRQTRTLRGRRYVIAAGAMHSPALLLRSGIRHPWLGRNYMYHHAPIVAGIFPRPTGAESAFIKQIGFADFYYGTPRFPHKLGVIQSLPVPGPLTLAKSTPRLTPQPLIHALHKRMVPLLGLIEDLPNPKNRVTLTAGGQPEVRHRFSDYDFTRGQYLARLMQRILRNAGAVFCVSAMSPSSEHIAHQCGTLRFGSSPRHAVVDPSGRLFGHDNVFVADGSLLPTSLGVGPALTIMALALRIARTIHDEL